MNLHPYSVPYRAVSRGGSLGALLYVGTAFSSGGGLVGAALLLPLLLVGLTLGVGWEFAYYRRFEYVVTDDTVDITSGVLSRRHREIPIRRIQNVDIRRNVVQRALDIAEVRLETAGGGETEASLRFVSFDEAKRLQRTLREQKSGVTDDTPPDADVLFELAAPELLLLSAVSFDARLLSILFVAIPFAPQVVPNALAGVAIVGMAVLAGLLVAAMWVAGAVATFTRFYGFTLSRIGDELQYERGLLRRYDGSIPLDKVQVVTVTEDLLKRRLGYASLQIETAGYSPGDTPSGGSSAAVPLATRNRVFALAQTLDAPGDITFGRPPKRARRRYAIRYALAFLALTGVLYAVDQFAFSNLWYAPLAGLVVAPVAAHYKWLHRGYALTDDHVVTRNGFWNREIRFVPYYRGQTIIEAQTVFQRRWGLATVTTDTAGSLSILSQAASAVDLDAADANVVRESIRACLHESIAARKAVRRERRERLLTEGVRDVGADA